MSNGSAHLEIGGRPQVAQRSFWEPARDLRRGSIFSALVPVWFSLIKHPQHPAGAADENRPQIEPRASKGRLILCFVVFWSKVKNMFLLIALWFLKDPKIGAPN